eukprot:ANDGO_01849.mRNA.1 putative GH family 25 lysozyme 2
MSCSVWMVTLVAFFALLARSSASVGIDMSSEICSTMSLGTWQCLQSQGYSFAIIEGFQGGGGVNQNLAQCVSDARSAGFAYVDTYIWSAPYCGTGSGSGDANALMDYINANGVDVGTVWVDVESVDGCMGDTGTNVDFYKDMTQTFLNVGWVTGVYSSPGEWGMTMGDADIASNLPLWGATYSYECNFGDVELFGGWGSIAMMQYSDEGNSCGIDYDLSCY